MTRARKTAVPLILLLLAATANASWYDDYDAGLAAARAGNWSVVVAKMSAAIKANGTENNKARTYGMDFRNYHPYYYRGVANLNLGKYEQAIADLEKTSGPGPENLGSIETLMDRAKKQLAAASEPPPVTETVRPTVPTTTTQAPIPSQPAAPQIDGSLRQRAAAAINTAKQKIQAAQQRRATASPQYTQALSALTDATTRNASVRSNDDLNTIIAMADNASTLADLATAPAIIPAPSPTPVSPKPQQATTIVLGDYTNQVRRALENYFAGEFELATRDFEDLSRKMPNNAWIFAFLGASQYSQYAFEADEMYKRSAERSFKRAKSLRRWNGGLPEKYFSRRIRNAFTQTPG
jgi:tetratricopeptide (TPR) repeat protein